MERSHLLQTKRDSATSLASCTKHSSWTRGAEARGEVGWKSKQAHTEGLVRHMHTSLLARARVLVRMQPRKSKAQNRQQVECRMGRQRQG